MTKPNTDKNLRAFELGVTAVYAADIAHQSPWHARDNRPVLISELCKLAGVKCIYMGSTSVEITKADSYDWEDLLPHIKAIISAHGNISKDFDSALAS